MKGIIYTDRQKMLTDLNSTSQLNDFTPEVKGSPRHIERDVNAIPYTYYIEHPDNNKWAIIIVDENLANFLGAGEELTDDWFTIDI
jgi:hypothetical protein